MREKPDFVARLHDVPHQPGVYLMRDRLNRIIYVGIYASLLEDWFAADAEKILNHRFDKVPLIA